MELDFIAGAALVWHGRTTDNLTRAERKQTWHQQRK